MRWSASDASAVCGLELQRSVDDGPFTVVALFAGTATATERDHAFGHRYCYRVPATDCAGNTSPWKTSLTFVPDAIDARPDTLPHTGAWSQLTAADSFNGTLTSSVTAGDSVSYTTTACRIAWIAPRDRDRGTAKVYVDGIQVATVNLVTGDRYEPYRRPRRVVWQKAWPTTAPHTIRIQVLSGRVDIDALGVLRCSRP